jgi:hypothetical protein
VAGWLSWRGWDALGQTGVARSVSAGRFELAGPVVLGFVLTVCVIERIRPAERRPLLARGHLLDVCYLLLYALLVVPLIILAILAQADPVKCAGTVIDRVSRLTPDVSDPAGMHLIGVAANAVWVHDLGLAFLTVAADGLRARGQLRLLAQALAAQAWAAVHLAREPLAVSAAEEGITLARETDQIGWVAAGQLAKAAIAAERGDLDLTETLTREAEALILPRGATPMLALVQFARGRAAVAVVWQMAPPPTASLRVARAVARGPDWLRGAGLPGAGRDRSTGTSRQRGETRQALA